jgi:hypothetical protein
VTQQMRIDAFGDPRGASHIPDSTCGVGPEPC